MEKLEKLKEINAVLKAILIDLETYIFIENINIENINKDNVRKQKVVVGIKQ